MTEQNLSNLSKPEKENTELVIPELEGKCNAYFKQISELQKSDIVSRTNCKMCMNPLRNEAEVKWEQTKGTTGKGNITIVQRFLNDNIDADQPKFTFHNVSKHIHNHYEQSVKKAWIKHYSEHLSGIMSYKMSKDEMFESMIQAAQLKFYEAVSNPQMDLTKQADIISKLTKTILDISLIQAKLRGDIDHVEVFKEKFTHVMVNFISNQTDPEQKQRLMQELDAVRDEMAG